VLICNLAGMKSLLPPSVPVRRTSCRLTHGPLAAPGAAGQLASASHFFRQFWLPPFTTAVSKDDKGAFIHELLICIGNIS